MDLLPQRTLVYVLRTAIDRAMRHDQERYVEAALRVVDENPRGARSSHVTHNLGATRLAWLRAHARDVTRGEGAR